MLKFVILPEFQTWRKQYLVAYFTLSVVNSEMLGKNIVIASGILYFFPNFHAIQNYTRDL